MFGGSAFLNPFPPGWDGFPGDPGGRRHCAFVRLLRLPGYQDIALRAERSGPTPASKSSKAQPAPGLLLEAQGGRGEASGSGRAAARSSWEGHSRGQVGWTPQQDPPLPAQSCLLLLG